MSGGASRALETLRAHAAAMTRTIVDEAGAGAVSAVFVGGSVAAGNVAWFQSDDLEIFSDIDLYVVARDSDDGRVDGAADRARTLPAPTGVRLMRPMDVGVYTAEDLMAQPARPGTVGLRRNHLTLHGDPAVVDAMVGAIHAGIDPGEGLYLVENRVRELTAAQATPGTAEGRLGRYTRVKTVLDVVCALRVASGRYADGNDDEAAIQAMADAGEVPGGWDDELVAAALAAAADIPGFLGAREDDVTGEERVVALALSVWSFLGARLLDSADDDWATLLLRRCRAGDYISNFREFLAIGPRRGRLRPRAAWTGAHMARYSAVASLRLGALIDAVLSRGMVDDIGMRSLDGLRAYLDRLTDVFGFRDGPLAERVNGMHRAISGG